MDWSTSILRSSYFMVCIQHLLSYINVWQAPNISTILCTNPSIRNAYSGNCRIGYWVDSQDLEATIVLVLYIRHSLALHIANKVIDKKALLEYFTFQNIFNTISFGHIYARRNVVGVFPYNIKSSIFDTQNTQRKSSCSTCLQFHVYGAWGSSGASNRGSLVRTYRRLGFDINLHKPILSYLMPIWVRNPELNWQLKYSKSREYGYWIFYGSLQSLVKPQLRHLILQWTCTTSDDEQIIQLIYLHLI